MQKEQDRLMMVPYIIFGALLSSNVLFLFLLLLSLQQPGIPLSEESFRYFLSIFSAFSLGLFLLSFYLPKLLAKATILRVKKKLSLGLSLTDKDLVSACLPAMIVRLALCEAISVLGLLIGLLGRDIKVALPFFAIGLLAMILARPNLDSWRQWVGHS